jgi:hypothetical protein
VSWQAAQVGNTVFCPSRQPMSPQVSRRRFSSSGCACPTSVGMDLPQWAQDVRKVGFPSAREALPLVGKIGIPISSHQVQATPCLGTWD